MQKYFGNFYLTDNKQLILSKCLEVNQLPKNAYWAQDRDASAMRTAILNSLNYAVFETCSNRLAGFARVVTDYATVFYLCDVFVDENFREIGLGKELIECIVLHEEKLREINGILKTRDAKGLYERYGFEECRAICMVCPKSN